MGTVANRTSEPKTQSPAVAGSTEHYTCSGSSPAYAGMLRLQRAVGNRAVNHFIQTKLSISMPGDRYEVEADRVADRIMSAPPDRFGASSGITHQRGFNLQRACDKCEEELQRKAIDDCDVQRQADAAQTSSVSANLGPQINAARGLGVSLPTSPGAFFESRFGYDFSQVRIHTGANAASMARAVNARAFTVGRDIFFGANQYSPGTPTGQRLVAHELTHVIQQAGAESSSAECMHLQREESSHKGQSQPSKSKAGQTQTQDAVLIATVIIREGDTPRSTMIRAVQQFGLSDEQSILFAAKLDIEFLGPKPLPGDPFPVYLTKGAVAALGKEIEAYEEGERPGSGSKGIPSFGTAKEPGSKEGEAGGKGTEEGGLGLIEVPEWVITTLKVVDVVLTIVTIVEGVGAIVVAIKAIAKQLMKQAIKRAIRKAAEEAAETIAKEALKKVTKKAAREGLEEALEEATKAAVKTEIKKSAEQAAKAALRKSMKKASEKEINEAAKELAEELSEEVAKKAAKKAVKGVIKEATKDFLTSSGILKNAAKAKIPLEKLTEYSLNPLHPVGGHKAKIIEKLLGYNKTNYQGFLRQLEEGVVKNKAVLGKADEFGQRFTVYIEMIGPKGKAVVESGWIFKPGSDIPQLVTALIP